MNLRKAEDDQFKSVAKISEQTSKGLTCTLDGCTEPLTMFQGPHSDRLCRPHQISQREYGGTGRIDRPWTFAREWCCTWCGYSPKDDPWFESQTWESDRHLYQAMRATLVADHIVRKTDGGGDNKENIQTLCLICNAKKTILCNDHQRSRIDDYVNWPL